MSQGTVLVTGASGYVGGRAVPRLLEAGWRVRASFTDPAKADTMWWGDRVEAVELDVLDRDQTREAVRNVDAVVYLVHGMGGDDFVKNDRSAAENMAAAVDAEGVRRIVYVSGIVPDVEESELSDHLTSRLEVERILSASSAVVITLRAAVILGSGSTSFEIVRQISERLPVQTVPAWMDSTVQPIAVVDLLECLVAALERPGQSRSFDVGGPDALPYPQLLDRYADIAGLTRPQVKVPLLPTALVGQLAGVFTEVPAPTVAALVESLHADMVCHDTDFRSALLPPGYHLIGLDESIRRSLADAPDSQQAQDAEPQDPAAADPMGPMPHDPAWASGGDERSLLAKAADAVRGALSTE